MKNGTGFVHEEGMKNGAGFVHEEGMKSRTGFVARLVRGFCLTNISGFVDRLQSIEVQERDYLYMGYGLDLQLYMPLMLPCFIDQGPWAVARVY
jgi:hypothetical protein